MKRFLKITAILFFSFIIASCGKDGCTDPTATNYNPSADNDDNSCIYSNSYLLNGDWNITNLQYDTQIDIPILGSQNISGEANDAGYWYFQFPEYTCSNSLNFVTEGIDILGQTLPGFPIDITNEGTWELTNDDNNILITDQTTGIISDYQILSIQENICFLNGTIPFVIDTMGFIINAEIDIEMQLNRQ